LLHATTAYDVFMFLKDVTKPTLLDNQTDDTVWRRVDPGAVYDADFFDAGGSQLAQVQYTVATATGLPGGVGDILGWTAIAFQRERHLLYRSWGINFAANHTGAELCHSPGHRRRGKYTAFE